MIELVVVDRDGAEHAVTASAGLSVMEALREAGLDELLALCGGNCSCATCHVYVDDAWASLLPSMSSDEDDLLDSSSFRTSRSRLSCQLICDQMVNRMRVTIAPEG